MNYVMDHGRKCFFPEHGILVIRRGARRALYFERAHNAIWLLTRDPLPEGEWSAHSETHPEKYHNIFGWNPGTVWTSLNMKLEVPANMERQKVLERMEEEYGHLLN